MFVVCRKELNKTGDPPPAASDPGEPTPSPPLTAEQAQGPSGGSEAAGGAGLTGFIQSALNQVFGGSTWPAPSQNHTSKVKLIWRVN